MANSIKISTLDADAIKIGSSNVTAVYVGSSLVWSGGTPPTPPTPTGQTPQFAVVDDISQYTATTFSMVYSTVDGKWYMLNNLNQYEEYGIYDTTGSSLSDYTYYDGKLAVIGTTEYQMSGGTWVEVGTYENSSVTYEIDDSDMYKYQGVTLSTTFKIPAADIEPLGGWLDLMIRDTNSKYLNVRTDRYDYGWGMEQGTVTNDGTYYNYSLPTTQEIVIDSIDYWDSTPIHLIVGSMVASVQYAEMQKPYGAKSFSSMTEAESYGDVYYGFAGHIGNDDYVFTTANTWSQVTPTQANYMKFKSYANANDFAFDNKATSGSLYVSYNLGNNWFETNSFLIVDSGTTVMFKGDLEPSSQGIGTFSSTNNFTVEGNAMSLLYGDNFSTQTSLSGKSYALQNIFTKCTNLTSAENLSLPATTLADYCYASMFDKCSSLTTAPQLPATTLATECYYCMFNGCTSLTTAPSLPATTLASTCYASMFRGCTNLTTAPSLPATTLADNCYGSMFYGCTSLTTAPSLPATTLAEGCYRYMFFGCTSLTTAPQLPATTLAINCYASMFYSCEKLTTAPSVLPATTLVDYCYDSMFGYCSSLTTAPSLLATTLASYCCNNMFRGCTSLTTAPSLLATTLTVRCYANMFAECTNLNSVTCLATSGVNQNYSTNYWLNRVSSTGTFTKAANVSWPSGVSGIPNGWTVVNYNS